MFPSTDDVPKRVRHSRQLLVWPLQLEPLAADAPYRTHWSALSEVGSHSSWSEVADEFGVDPKQFQERHYSEFVT